MTKSSIVIIGAGNVGHHLVNAFTQEGNHDIQVFSRTKASLSTWEHKKEVKTISLLSNIHKSADLYIIAVSDDAITPVINNLVRHIPDSSLIAHTSGASTIEVFKGHFKNYGSFYPLQSLRKDVSLNFREVPIFISSNSKSTENRISSFARKLSDRVISIKDTDRSKLHIPAIFVNNFVNHLYGLSYEYCKSEGLNFEYLRPLMDQTLRRISDGTNPADLQTGPAIRNDQITLRKHRKHLKNKPQLLRLYNYLSSHIKAHHEDRKRI